MLPGILADAKVKICPLKDVASRTQWKHLSTVLKITATKEILSFRARNVEITFSWVTFRVTELPLTLFLFTVIPPHDGERTLAEKNVLWFSRNVHWCALNEAPVNTFTCALTQKHKQIMETPTWISSSTALEAHSTCSSLRHCVRWCLLEWQSGWGEHAFLLCHTSTRNERPWRTFREILICYWCILTCPQQPWEQPRPNFTW